MEGTAGNTGIGLAHVCNARGYKCIIYMPDTQSQEKIDLLRVLGAEVGATNDRARALGVGMLANGRVGCVCAVCVCVWGGGGGGAGGDGVGCVMTCVPMYPVFVRYGRH